MEHKILQSIVEITRQRDLDSLELAFVATLFEMLPTLEVTLYRVAAHGSLDQVEETLSLRTDDEGQYQWNRRARQMTPDASLREALQALVPQHQRLPDGNCLWISPVVEGEKPLAALALVGTGDLLAHANLIDALTRVYGNYMTVLHEAEHDKLTGLLNRRTFDNKLSRLLRPRRDIDEAIDEPTDPGWLAVLDIDHFKRINDNYGHVYGDEILLLLAQEMRSWFGSKTQLFRVGGEEFVIAISSASAQEASEILDNFRQKIASRSFPSNLQVTVSIGYAQVARGDYPRQVFDQADKALYFAKNNGRNQTCCYQALVSDGHLAEQDSSGSIELF